MAEYSTPSQKKHSEEPSVFMTPSSSCGRPVYSAPKSYLTTPIPISPLTPLPTPKTKVDYEVKYCAVGEEHKDIITSLYEYGVPMLANRILSLLDPTETVSCRLVCQSWNTYISQRLANIVKPLSLTKSQSVTDENIRPSHSVKSRRTALATINSNSLNNNRTAAQTKLSQTSVGRFVMKLRPCPQCHSPAKKLNARRAECGKCSFDFCQDCLQTWHEESCRTHREIQLSPKKSQNNASIAGSKKSKRRLKRL